jgi:hypothetical protein
MSTELREKKCLINDHDPFHHDHDPSHDPFHHLLQQPQVPLAEHQLAQLLGHQLPQG